MAGTSLFSLTFSFCPAFFQRLSATAKGRLPDQNAQGRRGEHVAGEMDIEVQPREGDERRQRNGRPAEAAASFCKDRRADDRGQGLARGKGAVLREGDQRLDALGLISCLPVHFINR